MAYIQPHVWATPSQQPLSYINKTHRLGHIWYIFRPQQVSFYNNVIHISLSYKTLQMQYVFISTWHLFIHLKNYQSFLCHMFERAVTGIKSAFQIALQSKRLIWSLMLYETLLLTTNKKKYNQRLWLPVPYNLWIDFEVLVSSLLCHVLLPMCHVSVNETASPQLNLYFVLWNA